MTGGIGPRTIDLLLRRGALILWLFGPLAHAVEAAPSSESGAQPPDLEMAGSLGWRWTSVAGDRTKYRQHVNLDEGIWLRDAYARWQSVGRGDGFSPDRIELRLNDLGGEPYGSVSVRAERSDSYRLSYDRQISEYFYDDLLVLPEAADPEASTGGDFRRFDFERVRDRARLDLDISPRARAHLGFERYEKRGDGTTVMDIEREEYELNRPIDETMKAYEGGLGYDWDRVSLAISERYRTFDFASSMWLPEFSAGSDPAAGSQLDYFVLDQPYQFSSWEHSLKLQARPSDRLALGFNVILGTLDMDLQAAESSAGLDFTGAPFTRALRGGGNIDQDRTLHEGSARFAVTDRVAVFARLRSAKLEQHGRSTFEDTATGRWDIDNHLLEGGAELVLARPLVVTLGLSREQRDVQALQRDSVVVDATDQTTEADGYFVRVSYRPVRRLDLFLAYEDHAVDDPFSLASATDSRRVRLRGKYRWDNGVSISTSYRRSDRNNHHSEWSADSEQLEVRFGYDRDRLKLSLGYTDIELSRSVDQLVVAGSRSQPFPIRYGADARFYDATAEFRVGDRLTLGGGYRDYDNARSFEVSRDDLRLYLKGTLPAGYTWGLEYRNTDFAEGGLEAFDSDVVEVYVGARW
ncbi:MAG: porin [Pseudomonadales bacterium]